ETLNNSKYDGQQVVVQASSSMSKPVSQKSFWHWTGSDGSAMALHRSASREQRLSEVGAVATPQPPYPNVIPSDAEGPAVPMERGRHRPRTPQLTVDKTEAHPHYPRRGGRPFDFAQGRPWPPRRGKPGRAKTNLT